MSFASKFLRANLEVERGVYAGEYLDFIIIKRYITK